MENISIKPISTRERRRTQKRKLIDSIIKTIEETEIVKQTYYGDIFTIEYVIHLVKSYENKIETLERLQQEHGPLFKKAYIRYLNELLYGHVRTRNIADYLRNFNNELKDSLLISFERNKNKYNGLANLFCKMEQFLFMTMDEERCLCREKIAIIYSWKKQHHIETNSVFNTMLNEKITQMKDPLYCCCDFIHDTIKYTYCLFMDSKKYLDTHRDVFPKLEKLIKKENSFIEYYL